MTVNGVDYAWGRPGGAALAAAGITFAMRYTSLDPSKNLTRGEAIDLAQHGVGVGVVWETTARRVMDGYQAGAQDAAAALVQATAAGMPSGQGAIYVAVDFDVQDNELTTVDEYFRGWNTVIQPSATGVYGGLRAVDHVIGMGRAAHGWQTTAWSGGQWSGHASIRQDGGSITVNGVECDRNTADSLNGTGVWYPVGYAPAPSPTPAPQAPAWDGRYLQLLDPAMSGDDVRTWQERMAQRGWSITVDGWYGPQSQTVCRQFQQDSTAHGWTLTVDGVVGPRTWSAAWLRPVS